MGMESTVVWTAIYVARGSVEVKSRRLTGPHGETGMWDHALGLIDDGWLLALVPGSHEPKTGSLPVGKRAMDWLRGPHDD